jgi:hypothetical protein
LELVQESAMKVHSTYSTCSHETLGSCMHAHHSFSDFRHYSFIKLCFIE